MAKTKRTQTIIIKTFLLLFVFILLSMQPVFASSKLKKEDFTKMSGKYGENFISISSKYQSFFKYTNMIDETEKPAKILKTYRGVVLGDTKRSRWTRLIQTEKRLPKSTEMQNSKRSIVQLTVSTALY